LSVHRPWLASRRSIYPFELAGPINFLRPAAHDLIRCGRPNYESGLSSFNRFRLVTNITRELARSRTR
jgi:hypothetical protein